MKSHLESTENVREWMLNIEDEFRSGNLRITQHEENSYEKFEQTHMKVIKLLTEKLQFQDLSPKNIPIKYT